MSMPGRGLFVLGVDTECSCRKSWASEREAQRAGGCVDRLMKLLEIPCLGCLAVQCNGNGEACINTFIVFIKSREIMTRQRNDKRRASGK